MNKAIEDMAASLGKAYECDPDALLVFARWLAEKWATDFHSYPRAADRKPGFIVGCRECAALIRADV